MPASLRHGLLAAAFLAAYAFTYAAAPVAPPRPAAIAELPMALAPWSGRQAPPLAPEVAATLGADEYIRRYYATAPRRVVEMDVAYYAQPRVGATIHSPLNCLPGTGWRITKLENVRLDGPIAGAEVRALTVERGTHRFAMAYWFQSRDRVISGELSTRFHLLTDALRRRPTDAGLVRVMAPLTGADAANETVLAFASRVVPELARLF